ncbi:MAG: type 1 glutamine amidotransferase [Solirubrobacteraceae bacterium]
MRHAEFEGPGLFDTVARERGIELRTVATDLGEPVPDAHEVGAVVVLGGPFGVADAAARQHLADEQRLLADAARGGLPVMGICLGAQLLASGLGAQVRPAAEAEQGMYDVTLTAAGAEDPVLGPDAPRLRVFQFHEDAFEQPAGTTALAFSPACAQQGFRLGDRAYGLQFHIELPEDFAAYVPESFRPTRAERQRLEAVGRGIVERFFDLAAACPEP